MHDKSEEGYSGVFVINNPRYVRSALPIHKGDRVAIYVGRKNGGSQAVVALVQVTRKVNKISSTDKKHGKKRTWLQVAETKPIGGSGSCSLENLLRILEPDRRFKSEQAKGSYLSGRCACKVSEITREEFDDIGNYFPDHESILKLENISIGAFDDEEESGQGFASGEERKTIEDYAMGKAKNWLKNNGFRDIVNRSKNNSYDLSCTLNGDKYYVEVKGTRLDGASVIITQGEKCHAENNDNVILFLVRQISLNSDGKGGSIASGGIERILNPWNIKQGRLTPLSYRYIFPRI
jgi:hypothetical protein